MGSASGGLLGSAGGFGGQILGSALGSKLDDFVKSASELAAALSATSLDIEKVVKAAGETGPVAQKLIEETKAVAGAEEAAAAAARLLATQIGWTVSTQLRILEKQVKSWNPLLLFSIASLQH